jgi:hypothetical protein
VKLDSSIFAICKKHNSRSSREIPLKISELPENNLRPTTTLQNTPESRQKAKSQNFKNKETNPPLQNFRNSKMQNVQQLRPTSLLDNTVGRPRLVYPRRHSFDLIKRPSLAPAASGRTQKCLFDYIWLQGNEKGKTRGTM